MLKKKPQFVVWRTRKSARSNRFTAKAARAEVRDTDAASISELTHFICACLVGILNQWLATNDVPLLTRTTNSLIQAARDRANRLIA